MMAIFHGTPTQMKSVDGNTITWGITYNGVTFESMGCGTNYAEPGERGTGVTLRRVTRETREHGLVDELQVSVEIMQHYRSGAPPRRLLGSICLHGEALAKFVEAATVLQSEIEKQKVVRVKKRA